jgi:hypothetical protein
MVSSQFHLGSINNKYLCSVLPFMRQLFKLIGLPADGSRGKDGTRGDTSGASWPDFPSAAAQRQSNRDGGLITRVEDAIELQLSEMMSVFSGNLFVHSQR